MRKFTFTTLLVALSIGVKAQNPVLDSVEMGASYANEVYYLLEDGTKSIQPGNDWHIGFDTKARSATIFSNAKNTTVRRWPNGTNADFNTNIDVTDIASWPALQNDSIAIDEGGSFNKNALGMIFELGVPKFLDSGWGAYSFADHKLRGDSIYIVQIGTAIYKVDFIVKESGNMTLRYGLVDNTTGGTETTIPGSSYSKNFIFFNLENGEIKDRELEGWDLWTVQYHDWYHGNANQVVTGILVNPKWEVAKVDVGAGNQYTHTDFSGANFIKNKKNALGQSYKWLNTSTYQWEITNSHVYYLRDTSGTGDIWKWYPTNFVGAGFGKTVFYKQKVYEVGLTNVGNQFIEIFPNPASDQLTIAFDSKSSTVDIIIRNQMGQVVANENRATSVGITQQKLDISALANGLYYVEINQNGFATVKNVVKH
jgi:hypothetical protein